MTWADYSPPTTMVPMGTGGKEGPVRGLSLEDLGALIANNLDAMIQFTEVFIRTQKDVLAVTNYTDMMVLAARDFPALVSEVISLATDTPELRTKNLPATLQLNILAACAKLTVEDAGGLGNLSAMLQSAVRAAVAGRGEVSQKLKGILSPSFISDAEKTRTS